MKSYSTAGFISPSLKHKINRNGICVEPVKWVSINAGIVAQHVHQAAGKTDFLRKFEKGKIKIKADASFQLHIAFADWQRSRG